MNRTFTRKAEILAYLQFARDALECAKAYREGGSQQTARGFAELGQEWLDKARALMADAPASSRRRWKHSETINARKREARKPGYPDVLFRGRRVYQSI